MPARAIYINMKSHLFQLLLLFLLLVDTTHSARLSVLKGLFKPVSNNKKMKSPPNAREKKVDNATNQFSPTVPVGTPIPGLSEVKEYLNYFGYLRNTVQFDNILDDDTVSAIKTYQQHLNLSITGSLNNETFQQFTLLRCDVPDMNLDDSDSNVSSWPKGNSWFPKGTKNLTYGFSPASEIPHDMILVFRDAFMRWVQATSVMNFTETTYDDANIKIGFYDFDDSFLDTVVGGSFISDEDSNVNISTGVMYLDASLYWVLPSDYLISNWSWEDGDIDLQTVAMHQIGHLLGLDHSWENDSVMYPIMPTAPPTQQLKVLTDSDKETIHKLYADSDYAAAAGCFALFGSGSGLLTILSLGFAFMALLD